MPNSIWKTVIKMLLLVGILIGAFIGVPIGMYAGSAVHKRHAELNPSTPRDTMYRIDGPLDL